MLKTLIGFSMIAWAGLALAQQASRGSVEVAPGFRIATNTLSYVEGECAALLLRYKELYPSEHSKVDARFSKQDRDWISKQLARNNQISEKFLKPVAGTGTSAAEAFKKMPKGDAEFLLAIMETMGGKALPQSDMSMAVTSACTEAKLPHFLKR